MRLIAIAGGTGSGKSTLADELSQRLGASVIRIDDYYRPLNHLTFDERERVNFDAPDSIDHTLLLEQLSELLNGKVIQKPVYDFSKHTRAFVGESCAPTPVIILEGLFALYWIELNELAAVKIFVETPQEIRFERRLRRDIEERGRDEKEVTNRFHSHVNPMHEVFVQPTLNRADCVVSGIDGLSEAVRVVEGMLTHQQPARLI
jgi:uridine kinase